MNMPGERDRKQLCVICGAEAVFSYSPDLDIRGLGACEAHRTDVGTAYGILVYLGETDYDEFIAACRKKPKNV
jgi:hypothetical protein